MQEEVNTSDVHCDSKGVPNRAHPFLLEKQKPGTEVTGWGACANRLPQE
jgi:hypothetical protein